MGDLHFVVELNVFARLERESSRTSLVDKFVSMSARLPHFDCIQLSDGDSHEAYRLPTGVPDSQCHIDVRYQILMSCART